MKLNKKISKILRQNSRNLPIHKCKEVFYFYGKTPIVISLDDYFKDRVDTPKDENGEYDLIVTKANKDEENQDYKNLLAYYGEKFESKTNIKKMVDAVNWHTVYSSSIDWSNPNRITLRFMEDESMTYTFDVSDGCVYC